MIFDANDLPHPARIRADLCVVGSGAGGMMAAMVAAEAGLSVVVLEAGEYLTPADMTQREDEMFPRLYWDSGGRTTVDRAVKIHQGRGVGGSTLHNLNLCKRIPLSIRQRWERERGMETLPATAWDALYDEVEAMLEVSEVPRDRMNRHNQLLAEACAKLGWAGGSLRHNRSGCIGSGFCEVGCSYDAKNNAAKVLLPRAVAKGADVIHSCQAVRVLHSDGAVASVTAYAMDPVTRTPVGELVVEASRVCLAGSATGTPALLLRSNIPDPGGETGNSLRIHPAVVVAGEMEEAVRAWDGIPQTYECTELLQTDRAGGHRVWIVPAFAHPVGTAVLVPGLGAPHRAMMKRYGNLAVLTAMIHDEARGTVRPDGELRVAIDYWPDEGDRRELALGLEACAKLLFAAGAKRVFVPSHPAISIEAGASVAELAQTPIVRGGVDLTAVHPMGSVPMGEVRTATVDSEGRHRAMKGLWIADGSLFPSSVGVPPQLSIYALGLHVGRAIARS